MRTILLLLFLLFSCPAPSNAADKALGVIMSGNIEYYQEVHEAFVITLAKEGFDSRMVDTFVKIPSPDLLSWTNAARRLTVADVNVIVAFGAPATLAAMTETKSIPLVFAAVYDPAAIGCLARNVTGISSKVPITSLLRYL